MSTEPSLASRRTLGLLTLTLFIVGSCGVLRGVEEVTSEQPPLAATLAAEGTDPDLEEATESLRRRVDLALYQAPYRRPMALAHLVVSALCLVSLGMLVARRASAPWWITQAAVANMLWGGAQGARQFYALSSDFEERLPYYEQLAAAQQQAEDGAALFDSRGLMAIEMLSVGVAVVVHLLLFAWILWLGRRETVKSALQAPSDG